MITWKDFVMDDILGPILAMPEELAAELVSPQDSRAEQRLGSSDTSDGASGNNAAKAVIQETRQEQRPARMVGLSSHDSAQVDRKSAECNRANDIAQLNGGEGV